MKIETSNWYIELDHCESLFYKLLSLEQKTLLLLNVNKGLSKLFLKKKKKKTKQNKTKQTNKQNKTKTKSKQNKSSPKTCGRGSRLNANGGLKEICGKVSYDHNYGICSFYWKHKRATNNLLLPLFLLLQPLSCSSTRTLSQNSWSSTTWISFIIASRPRAP